MTIGSKHASGILCPTHRTYGLSCKEYETLWTRCGGCCESCGRQLRLNASDRVIDHDHRYGNTAVRGIICASCNQYLCQIESPRINPVFPAGPGRHFASYFQRAWFTRAGRDEEDAPPEYLDHAAVRKHIRKWSTKNRHLHTVAPKAVVVPTDQVRELVRILRAAMSPQAFARLAKLINEEAAIPKRLTPPAAQSWRNPSPPKGNTPPR
ncbi:endonuclease domain-containing protein [Streptomyces sp. Z26]|uniref:endonuclease domain-containing protein n=1 Tax=Streptomyces sp. Z26 TaxID=2500177 RepID=UPI000EF17302|nr:endonuclease domain-containing protein [Streptomyces sp. Z26]RLL67016.1 hypothetical protein D7M15_09210 [Streptomyces sp. Z26]